jgi:hypothetical protein
VFVVDPLDGTTNFLHGFPAYAVSIGAMAEGEVVAGVILDVPHGELFTVTAGGGAFLDGQPIRVSSVRVPGRALVGTGFLQNLGAPGRLRAHSSASPAPSRGSDVPEARRSTWRRWPAAGSACRSSAWRLGHRRRAPAGARLEVARPSRLRHCSSD